MKKLAHSNRLLSLEQKQNSNTSSERTANPNDPVYFEEDRKPEPQSGAMGHRGHNHEGCGHDGVKASALKYSAAYNQPPISAHISYEEATRSATAQQNGVSNDPNAAQLANMRVLAERVFEPIRTHFNVPIYISSFFRTEEVNRLVGGSPTSDHMTGRSVDIDMDGRPGPTNAEIFHYIRENLEFDQLIWELGNDTNPGWVHVSYREGNNRNQVLRYDGSTYTPFSTQHSVGYSAPQNGDPFPNIRSEKFKRFLPQILRFEGGFVNDPDDPGGATNKGITIGTFRRHAQSVLGIEPTLENLKNITDQQAGQIYEVIYWDGVMGEQINDVQVAYQFVDFYINAGRNAVKVMQRTLNGLGKNVAVDGVMGDETLGAINSCDGATLFEAYKRNRQAYYEALVERRPNMEKFLRGWTRRTDHFVYQNSILGKSLAHTHSGLLTHSNGWLRVKLDSGDIVSLSQYARVSNVRMNSAGTRELFTIDDWPYAGQTASVAAKSGGGSRFGSVSYDDGGTVIFDSSTNKLKYGSSGWIPTAMSTTNTLSEGIYDIWVPDYPHGLGNGYSRYSDFSTVWFRIGEESSSRYLHLGNVSAGCVTVGATSEGGTDAHKREWTDLYNYLIKRRKNNGGKHVGQLIVR